MKITKKIQPVTSSFFLENSELEEVKEFKDLGIISGAPPAREARVWAEPHS